MPNVQLTARPVSRRFAFASATAAVLLGVSACGDPGSVARSTPGSIPVIRIAAGGPVGNASGANAPTAESSRMMMPLRNVDYVFEGALPSLGDAGAAWFFPAGAPADLARVGSMASALGVEGEVRALPADQGGGWMVGAADYSGASLMVGPDAMQSWWFNPGPQAMSGGWACPDSVTVGESTTDPATDPGTAPATESAVAPPTTLACPEPEPPIGVPSETEALSSAKALFASLGYEPGAYDYDVYADDWSASVSASLLLDGRRSPISITVGFGAEGAITWASGSLAVPQRGADYPLVGAQAGLDRLNDESNRWMGFGGYPGIMARGVAVDASPELPAPSGQVPVDPVLVAPMPGECGPAVDCLPVDDTPITITLTDVRLDSTMVWAEDGTVWLLPAYTFIDRDGGQYTVIAVDDGFIELPETLPVPEPLPADTVTVETVTVDTVTVETGPTTSMVEPETSVALPGSTG